MNNDRNAKSSSTWRSATVLVAEDDPVCLKTMARSLELCGYSVLTAERATVAIELFQESEGKIDVLLTDYFMPDLNGTLLAEKLCALKPGLKVLFMTGYMNQVIHIMSSVEYWTDEILVKPIAPEMLDEVVQSILMGRPRSQVRSSSARI